MVDLYTKIKRATLSAYFEEELIFENRSCKIYILSPTRFKIMSSQKFNSTEEARFGWQHEHAHGSTN